MLDSKRNLILVVSVLLVVGFLATSLSSFFVSRTSLRSQIIQRDLPLTSDNIYSEIQQDLMRPIFISSLMATNTFLRDWVINGEKDVSQITRYLKEIKTKYDTVTSFFISERTKRYYYADGILKKVSSKEERDKWYFRVREMEPDYEVNVDPDMANRDTMTIFINYRVFDYHGNYIGATGVGLTVSAVKEIIEDYQKKFNRTVYFVDRNGTVKLHSSTIPDLAENIFEMEGVSNFAEKILSTESGSFSFGSPTKSVHLNTRYIPEFDWYLVVEQAEAKAVRQLINVLIINLATFALITTAVLYLVNMAITAYQSRIETLRGIIPICSFCKQIRDDQGYWKAVEAYVGQHTQAEFSHSICPECLKTHYPTPSAGDGG